MGKPFVLGRYEKWTIKFALTTTVSFNKKQRRRANGYVILPKSLTFDPIRLRTISALHPPPSRNCGHELFHCGVANPNCARQLVRLVSVDSPKCSLVLHLLVEVQAFLIRFFR